jgi:hypothetical protein
LLAASPGAYITAAAHQARDLHHGSSNSGVTASSNCHRILRTACTMLKPTNRTACCTAPLLVMVNYLHMLMCTFACRHACSNFEDMQVLRYGSGQQYRPHQVSSSCRRLQQCANMLFATASLAVA